ncbi:hypothetical protein HHK36_029547 [Tetracentron sinense]|uniref:Fe-S metabolism associated domain-containing protein n=1 Tax=Tetracentron sinense TaxID=13715 RepID=A0A834YBV4_TETSI|nr:hypothetical protein HHK36_029547 [Tetracentron sinense]
MDSATSIRRASSSCNFTRLSNPNARCSRLRFHMERERRSLFKSLKCVYSSDSTPISSVSCSAVSEIPSGTSEITSYKLRRLVSEFKSLSEPIDRVKRLLHYAALLPRFDESARIPLNRVMACTVQVWLDSSVDEDGRMRFSAYSDSEITKGFCSCLIWILDGAFPDEVLKLKTEDLEDLNVGLPGRARSRVNTWHNVLIGMQERTKAIVAEREGKLQVGVYRMSNEFVGCSLADAAASPGYMNILEAVSILLTFYESLCSVLKVRHYLPTNFVSAHEVGRFNSKTPLEKPVADIRWEPILYMRHFEVSNKNITRKASQSDRSSAMRDGDPTSNLSKAFHPKCYDAALYWLLLCICHLDLELLPGTIQEG